MDVDAYMEAWMNGATDAEAVRAGEDACFENKRYEDEMNKQYEEYCREQEEDHNLRSQVDEDGCGQLTDANSETGK